MGNSSYITARAHPHQAAFVEQFFSKDTKQNVLLQHHVGMGSSFAAMEVIRRHLQEHPKGRVLVLGAAVVLQQWERTLVEIGLDADLIDLFRYRELLEQSPGQRALWRSRSVVLMRSGYGHKEAVTTVLAEDHWSLIVVDESHRLLQGGRSLLNTVRKSSPQARVLLLSPLYVHSIQYQDFEPLTIVRWDWQKIARSMDIQGHYKPELDLRFVNYELSDKELRLRERTAQLRHLSGRLPSAGYLSARNLLNSFVSSPAAYEETLLRYRNKLVHGVTPDLFDADMDNGELEQGSSTDSVADQTQWLQEINTCLAELESLGSDPKLEGFIELIKMVRRERPSRSAIILTEFKSTVYYVQARLEEEGIDSVGFHSGLQADMKYSALTEIRNSSVLLVATNSILGQGFNLSFLDDAVFYDLPRNEISLHRLLNQLGVARRTEALHLSALVESTNSVGRSRMSRQVEKVADEWGFRVYPSLHE